MRRVVFRKDEKGQIPVLNMTSMIDVIFLLLIFFVFTTNFNEIEKFLPMSLNTPGRGVSETRAESVPMPDTELRVRILTAADGNLSWAVNDREYNIESDLAGVLKQFAETDQNQQVIIYPGETATVESVLDLYGLCRSVGLMKIRFAAKKK